MGIFERMSNVLSSNVNALIDRVDDPAKSIEQIVLDMREQITAGQRELVSQFASQKQLQKKVEELDVEAEKWAKRAELALKADDEALAREALVQKKRVVGDRDRAEAMLAEAKGATLRLKSTLTKMEDKLRDVEARKGTIAVRAQQAKAGGGVEALGATGPDNAFAKFREFEAKIEGVEAEAQAMREVDDVLDEGPSADALEAKFAALEGRGGGLGKKSGSADPAIDDEMAALKQKMRVK
jgi:phage shock protein A